MAEQKSLEQELAAKVAQLQGQLAQLYAQRKQEVRDEKAAPIALPAFKESAVVLRGHFGKVYGMHWSSDSSAVVSAAQDGKLIIWRGHNGSNGVKERLVTLRSNWVMCCGMFGDGITNGCVAAGGLDNTISIYKVASLAARPENGKATPLYGELIGHEGYISSIRFFEGGKSVVTSSGDGSLILWDTESLRARQKFLEHTHDVMNVSVGADQHTFLSGSVDTFVKLWDTRTGNAVMTFNGHESDVNWVEWIPDSTAFVSGSEDCTARVFDARACAQLTVLSDPKIGTGVTSVAPSKSGRIIFASYDSPEVLAWDTLSGKIVQRLNHHAARVAAAGVSPDGQVLCTASWDMTLRMWC